MIGIPIGLLVSNGTEWAMHKYVLHGLGKDKKSWWSFHWHLHHKAARRNKHIDEDYARPLFKSEAMFKEAIALGATAVAIAPFFPVAPFLVGTFWYSGANYYRKHKRAHLDAEWAREHLPWHYDHHMGPNQNANWCVTKPWFDDWLGTREPYVGTEREAKDRERARKREAKQRSGK